MIVSVDRRITTRTMRIFLRKSGIPSGTLLCPALQDRLILHSEASDSISEPFN